MNQTNAPPTVLELKVEAHKLIEIISRRPGAIKLLTGLLPLLKLYAQYKMKRS